MLSKNRNIKMLNKLDTLNIFIDLLMCCTLLKKKRIYIYKNSNNKESERKKDNCDFAGFQAPGVIAGRSVYVMHRICENNFTYFTCINLKHILTDYQLIPFVSLLYFSIFLNLVV